MEINELLKFPLQTFYMTTALCDKMSEKRTYINFGSNSTVKENKTGMSILKYLFPPRTECYHWVQ
jgi:hypothetical protein